MLSLIVIFSVIFADMDFRVRLFLVQDRYR
jgi:hypothetical protein